MPVYGLIVPLFFLTLSVSTIHAEVYNADKVIGALEKYPVKKNDSLIEIGRTFGVGYNAITDANPDLDPFVPGTGAIVVVPTSWVVPHAGSTEVIVINLSEMRLYYFFSTQGSRSVATFPIGIGSEGNNTPMGEFRVVEKIINPVWHVPRSIKKQKPWLPDVVPPGPDNPLGTHAIRLSSGTVLIHGTNKPWGVGRKVSHGCIRLYPEDIPRLFSLVNTGTRVSIVRQPVKVGVKDGRVYVEVHEDKDVAVDYTSEAARMLVQNDLLDRISTRMVSRAILEKKGIPVDITYSSSIGGGSDDASGPTDN